MTIGIFFLWSCANVSKEKEPLFKHVIVIGFDGLSPDGIKKANTPELDKIIKEGSHTFHARAVLPTSSSSNWASMIMGAGPEQHGITSNGWEKDNFILPPVTQDEDFLFPTIFNLVNKQNPEAQIGAIYHWGGFGRLFEKNALDYDINSKTEEETATLAADYIKSKKPTFTFIHFDHVDHAGHEYGHGTQHYYDAVEKADSLLGIVLEGILEAGIAEDVLLIISADHGGVGKGHGGESLSEIEIPFILWGKGIKSNYVIKQPVYQYDNAATVAYALGINRPHAWIGKPVKSAFIGNEITDELLVTERLTAPKIIPTSIGNSKAGGLFDSFAEVVIENVSGIGEIRYTLDGSLPSTSSELYENPFQLKKTTLVKSAIFVDGKINSMVEEGFFRIKEPTQPEAVTYELYYLDQLLSVPYLSELEPDFTGKSFEITLEEVKEEIKQNTAIRFQTKIMVDSAQAYGFFTRSDDGSKLWVDEELVVDNDGNHGVKEKAGRIDLEAGIHTIEVIWFNGGGSGWLDVFYQTRNSPKQILSTEILNTDSNI